MTKRIEQSRRHGHHDPRYAGNPRLTLVPAEAAEAPDAMTEDLAAFAAPTVLRLLPEPSLPPVVVE